MRYIIEKPIEDFNCKELDNDLCLYVIYIKDDKDKFKLRLKNGNLDLYTINKMIEKLQKDIEKIKKGEKEINGNFAIRNIERQKLSNCINKLQFLEQKEKNGE